METNHSAQYIIWGADNAVYGPVELPTLVNWVKDERVTADTWVFDMEHNRWQKAPNLTELQLFFRKKTAAAESPNLATDGSVLKPGMLRRIKALAELSDEQLTRLMQFMESQNVRQWTQIVKQGESDDGMYLVLDGELRVRLMIGGKETILTTLGAGECFGEIAVFDKGPRSADVLANKDSVLLKISAESFAKLLQEAPELAAPMLFSIGKTLSARIRADNKRIKDSVNFARSSQY
jgi:CRP/FNR family cyclic AMP-dependent transcriptional regulator